MSSDWMIRAAGLGKAYEFYPHYADRFKQLMWGRFKTYYRHHWVLRDIDFEIHRGKSFGIYYLANGICVLVGTAIFGLIYQQVSPQAAFFTGAALALGAVLVTAAQLHNSRTA